MRTVMIVVHDPRIEIGLQFFECRIDLLAEGHLIKLLQDGLVEALADAVGLRVIRFGLGVFNVIHRQEQFVIVLLDSAAVLGAPIREQAQ